MGIIVFACLNVCLSHGYQLESASYNKSKQLSYFNTKQNFASFQMSFRVCQGDLAWLSGVLSVVQINLEDSVLSEIRNRFTS